MHERVGHTLLGQGSKQPQHIGNTLSSVRGGGDQGDVASHRLVLEEQLGVETLLGESQLGSLKTGAELVLNTLVLHVQTVLETVVVNLLPAVQTIDLVQSDDEGCFAISKQSQRFQGLCFQAMLIRNEGLDAQKRAIALP